MILAVMMVAGLIFCHLLFVLFNLMAEAGHGQIPYICITSSKMYCVLKYCRLYFYCTYEDDSSSFCNATFLY